MSRTKPITTARRFFHFMSRITLEGWVSVQIQRPLLYIGRDKHCWNTEQKVFMLTSWLFQEKQTDKQTEKNLMCYIVLIVYYVGHTLLSLISINLLSRALQRFALRMGCVWSLVCYYYFPNAYSSTLSYGNWNAARPALGLKWIVHAKNEHLVIIYSPLFVSIKPPYGFPCSEPKKILF